MINEIPSSINFSGFSGALMAQAHKDFGISGTLENCCPYTTGKIGQGMEEVEYNAKGLIAYLQ